MDDLFMIIDFLYWIFQATYFVLGVGLGIVGTLTLGPVLYRRHRSLVLRRDWRRNRPHPVVESLTPEWGPYDPDLKGVGKRCICHHRVVHPGENVLLWPETGPLGVLNIAVYCETIRERL
jgi:hypothetical protein